MVEAVLDGIRVADPRRRHQKRRVAAGRQRRVDFGPFGDQGVRRGQIAQQSRHVRWHGTVDGRGVDVQAGLDENRCSIRVGHGRQMELRAAPLVF